MSALQLNPEQKTAVTTVDRPILVLAGAGSGKTRVVAARIAYLIRRKGVKPDEILGMTFTNKAAREMRERVAISIGKQKSSLVTLSTFHSLGCTILRNEIHHLGYQKNFSIYGGAEQLSLITGILRDLYGNGMSMHPLRMQSRLSHTKNRMMTADTFEPQFHDKYDKVMPAVLSRYETSLRACNAVDFDDLLVLVLRLFQEHPKVAAKYRKKYKHLIVDEYQDTNPLQFRLVEELANGGKGLCVVGDDDQSIYAWRGADIQNILSFEKQHPECLRVTLDTNYRSTNTILTAANSVIGNNPGRHEKKLRSDLGEGVCVDLMKCTNENDEAVSVIERIIYYKNRFDLEWRDFAILYRANNLSKPFERVLVQQRLPYRVIGGTEAYDRKEVRDVMAYLQTVVNPNDSLNLLRILNYPRRGIGETSVERIMAWSLQNGVSVEKALRSAGQIPGLTSDASQGIDAFLKIVGRFRREARAKSKGKDAVSTFVSELIEATGIKDELHTSKDSRERINARIQNIDNLIETARRYESEAGANASAREFLTQMALVVNNDSNKDEREEVPNRITLMTLHGAKGLEFPFVFMVAAEDGILPHTRSLRETGGVHEERRLFYVGVTRARRHLTITHAEERATENGAKHLPPSRFIAEIPDELLNVSHSSQGNDHCYLDRESASARLDIKAMMQMFQEKRAQSKSAPVV